MSNVNYSFTENGVVYDFDDVFVPAEIFRRPSLWIWGSNLDGNLGINAATNRSTPVTTILGGTNWRQLHLGAYYTMAIKTDGTLWTWGYNQIGNLGINATTSRITPVTTILGGTNWKQISSNAFSSSAIKTDGTLWTWGYNSFGQLGINATTDRSTPVTTILGGTNWQSVSSGNLYTAAIKTDGTLWLWGSNYYTGLGNNGGQLGINNTIDRSTPVTTILGGNNWKSVACGYHTLAIKTDGTLWIWGGGYANFGQLGINNTINKSTPVTTILGGNNWKSIDCGSGHSVAIKTDGTLWTWGVNTYGQLGINATTDRSTPVTTILGGTNWKQISCGAHHTSAIKTDGTLWTWGINTDTGPTNFTGQLGINATTNRSTPVTTILGGNTWKLVASGGYNTSAIEYEPDP
jgi:alpha-tubulin suppressor-like RCC1 family protein